MSKKIKLFLITVIIFLLIIGPITINMLFKWNSGIKFLEAEWTAGDMLSFFGSILGAFIGIIGVYISIEKAQNNYRDDLRNQVLPFFALNFLDKQIISFFEIAEYISSKEQLEEKLETKIDEIQYRESKLRKVYFIINENKIEAKKELTKEQLDLLKTGGDIIKYGESGEMIFERKLIISQPIEFENVGKGTAINVRIGFNKKGTRLLDRMYIKPVNLGLNECFYVNIFSDKESKNIIGEYILEIRYSDIYNNKYFQEYLVSILQNEIEGYKMTFEFETKQNR